MKRKTEPDVASAIAQCKHKEHPIECTHGCANIPKLSRLAAQGAEYSHTVKIFARNKLQQKYFIHTYTHQTRSLHIKTYV